MSTSREPRAQSLREVALDHAVFLAGKGDVVTTENIVARAEAFLTFLEGDDPQKSRAAI